MIYAQHLYAHRSQSALGSMGVCVREAPHLNATAESHHTMDKNMFHILRTNIHL